MMIFKDVRIRGLKVDKQTPNQNVELTLCFPASGHGTLLDQLKSMCIDVTNVGSKQSEYIIQSEYDKPFKCELGPDDNVVTEFDKAMKGVWQQWMVEEGYKVD